VLALKNVTKEYEKNRVLNGASLAVKPKDCVCVIGDGGSGKTTIFNLFIRATDPDKGTVEVDGIPLTAVPPEILQLYRRRLGMSFQEPVLMEHATTAENIAYPLELFGAPEQAVTRAVGDLLQRLALSGFADRQVETLSASQRALVGIARAVVASPMILLADEPLQHLDAAQSKAVVELFSAMHKKGTTLILFSRNREMAKVVGARSVVLKDGHMAEERVTSSPVGPATTHRILEETEGKVQAVLDARPVRRPGTPKNDKKIRITSIGSGL
jgi:ABC-type ATPase involved in cell division